MSKLIKFAELDKYSDEGNTILENGVELGFGFVLGISAALILIMLLFFVFRAIIQI